MALNKNKSDFGGVLLVAAHPQSLFSSREMAGVGMLEKTGYCLHFGFDIWRQEATDVMSLSLEYRDLRPTNKL